MKKTCDFFAKIHNFLCFSSAFYCEVYEILKYKYELDSFIENDIDAIMARIYFTQNHEELMLDNLEMVFCI